MSTAGSGAVAPVFMNCRSVGGGDWNYQPGAVWPETLSGQKGVLGGFGLNNVGLLVRVFGRVTQGLPGDPGPIPIDDGSKAPVEVVLPSGTTSPGQGAYVVATGVVSCKKVGQQITRVILANAIQVL
jgi:hypothetical protein